MIFLASTNHYKARLPQDHTMLLTSLQGRGKISRGAGLATREGEKHCHEQVEGDACRNRDPGEAERDYIEEWSKPVLPGYGFHRLLICFLIQESILMRGIAPEQIKEDRQKYERSIPQQCGGA